MQAPALGAATLPVDSSAQGKPQAEGKAGRIGEDLCLCVTYVRKPGSPKRRVFCYRLLRVLRRGACVCQTHANRNLACSS